MIRKTRPIPTCHPRFVQMSCSSSSIMEGRGVVSSIDFATRIEAAYVYRTDDGIAPWFELLEAGAFALPVGCASETDSIAGALTLFHEQALEITVNCFQASEAAWSALINMLEACWSETSLLSTVTVE